jgi:hypothetical protein
MRTEQLYVIDLSDLDAVEFDWGIDGETRDRVLGFDLIGRVSAHGIQIPKCPCNSRDQQDRHKHEPCHRVGADFQCASPPGLDTFSSLRLFPGRTRNGGSAATAGEQDNRRSHGCLADGGARLPFDLAPIKLEGAEEEQHDAYTIGIAPTLNSYFRWQK